MNKVITTNIAPGKGQAFGELSLNHLQSAFGEITEAMVQAVNQGRKPVVYLTGCTVATAGTIHSNAAGWAYYAGEVFLVDAASVNTSGTPEWVIQQDFANGGNVPFTNLEFHDVLAIRKLRLAAPGSGGVAVTEAESYPVLLATLPALLEVLNTKANKQQPVWQDLEMLNGYATVDVPYMYKAQMMKDEFGFVNMRGVVVVPATPSSFQMFTLPSGFRPARQSYFRVRTEDTNISYTRLNVLQSGAVTFSASSTAASQTIYLDGIRFQADGN